MLRALFFDLDGTLCQPTERFADVFTACLAPLAPWLPEPGDSDVLARWTAALLRAGSSSTADCLAQVLSDGADQAGAPPLATVARDLNACWAAAQRPAPDALTVLDALAARYPLGLITNGPSDAQRAVVEALGVAPYFRWLLVSGDPDLGIRKPNPAIFHRALQLAGCPPEAALYIGDSPANDIAGAASAGLRSCWLNPAGQPLPTAVPRPDLQIVSLRELLTVLPR